VGETIRNFRVEFIRPWGLHQGVTGARDTEHDWLKSTACAVFRPSGGSEPRILVTSPLTAAEMRPSPQGNGLIKSLVHRIMSWLRRWIVLEMLMGIR
jgi:hypothetical protein